MYICTHIYLFAYISICIYIYMLIYLYAYCCGIIPILNTQWTLPIKI